MSSRITVLVLPSIFLLIAGCGGAKHASSTGANPSTAGSGPASTASSTPSVATPSTPPPATRATSGARPSPGKAGSSGGSVNARVPATFRIGPGGKLNPRTVSSPAFIAVQVTLSAADGRAHQVVVRTPTTRTLTVPAHGRASLLIAGLRAGQYRIDVDGSPGGALLIGGEPGP